MGTGVVGTPDLPPGFTIDAQPTAAVNPKGTPDLPPGFTIDTQPAKAAPRKGTLATLLPDVSATVQAIKGMAADLADRMTRPAFGLGQRGAGETAVQPWADLAGKAEEQLGAPLRNVPGGGYLLDALEGATKAAPPIVGGALDFATSPAGALTMMAGPAAEALAPNAAGYVEPALKTAFSTQMAPQAASGIKKAIADPSGENVGAALASTGAALSPAAPELAAGVRGGLEAPGKAIEAHNARAAALVEQERRAGQQIEGGRKALGADSIPVRVGDQTYTVEAVKGSGSTTRPAYLIRNAEGKPVFAGYGENAQGYLRMVGATPLNEPAAKEATYEESQPTGPVPQPPPAVRASERAKAARPQVPETGPSDLVQRVQDARENLAQQMAGKPFRELTNPERLVIDHFVTQGYGFSAQAQKENQNGNVSDAHAAQPRSQAAQGQENPVAGKQLAAPAGKPAESARPGNAQAVAARPEAPRLAAPVAAKPAPPVAPAAPQEAAASQAPPAASGPQNGARAPKVQPAYGNRTDVMIPGENTRYPVRYAVREAADVQPSHNPFSFEPNPSYEHTNDRDYSNPQNSARVIEHGKQLEPRVVLANTPTAEQGAPIIDTRGNALGGNNRTMAIKRAYAYSPERAQAYRDELTNRAQQFGIDPQEIGRFREPVLVREMAHPTSGPEAQIAITDLNKTATAQTTPAEQAVKDGKRLTPSTVSEIGARIQDTGENSTLAQAIGGERGSEVLQLLVKDGAVTPQEANGYVDERGHLTPEAKDRIAKALVGRLYETPQQFASTPPEMRAKLERIAPQVLRTEGRAEWSLAPAVREAAAALEDARAHRISNLDDLSKQRTLDGAPARTYSPEAIAIAKKLQESPTRAAAAFRQYANDEALSRPGMQSALFEPPSQHEAFAAAFGAQRAIQTSREVSAPRLRAASWPYVQGAPDMFHAAAMRFEPVELPERDSSRAVAFVTNRSGMEFLSRWSGGVPDRDSESLTGVHLGPDVAATLAKELGQRAAARPGSALQGLIEAAAAAARDGRSLIAVRGERGDAHEEIREALAEELDHARQRAVTGGNLSFSHLGESAAPFVDSSLGSRALRALRESYPLRSPHEAAAEIGVRLMRRGGHEPLGLDIGEARLLGAQYVRALRKEYGYGRATKDVAGEVFAALRRRNRGGPAEPGASAPGLRRGGGSGPAPGDATRSPAERPEDRHQTGSAVHPPGRETARAIDPLHAIQRSEGSARGDNAARPVGERDREAGGISVSAATLGLDKFLADDVRPAVQATAENVASTIGDAMRAVAPAAMSAPGRLGSEIFRESAAEMARAYDRAEAALAKAKDFFERQDPAENYEFIRRMEAGLPQKTRDLDAVAKVLRTTLDELRAQVQGLGKGKLQQYYENYFPHIWQNPRRAAEVFGAFFGRRPLEGGKAFLKKRTLPTFEDGLNAGLKPVSDNPVELVLLKAREMDRYIMAHSVLNEWKHTGLAKFVPAIGGHAPGGFRRIEDPIGVVYGNPEQKVSEYLNKGLVSGLRDILAALKLDHRRRMRMPGGPGTLGVAWKGTNRLATKFATDEQVLAHEIGHHLEFQHPFIQDMLHHPDAKTRAALKRELRDLADLRYETNPAASQHFKSYVRSADEKAAAVVQAYVAARDRMRQVAPTVMSEFEKHIANTPAAGLKDIRPSLESERMEQTIHAGGLVVRGHWYAADGAATILENYLSPGLRRFGAYRTLIGLNNVLTQAKLGMSAFHVGKVTLEAQITKLAGAIEMALRGRPLAGLKAAAEAAAPGLPAARMLTEGSKMLREWYKPGSEGGAIAEMVRHYVEGGGRARMDEFYRTHAAQQMMRALRRGNWAGAAVRAPFAAIETMAKPIMEFLVPRMKMGAFADGMRVGLERLGPGATAEQVRAEAARRADEVDNRLGQMVYDNQFWNRTVKDLAMVSMLSPGWNVGTLKAVGGGLFDAVKEPLRLAGGAKPADLRLDRISYVAAMVAIHMLYSAIYQYLHTGQAPDQAEDYFFPRTGELDASGRPQRAVIPSYLKDAYDLGTAPARTLANKTSPVLSMLSELVRNQDYFHRVIRNPDDPVEQQFAEVAQYLGRAAEPLGIERAGQERAAGASPERQAEQFFGMSNAPSDLDRTPAERLAAQLEEAEIPAGGRTAEEMARREAAHNITRLMRAGGDWAAAAERAMEAGTLSSADVKRAIKRGELVPLAAQFEGLSAENAMKVWRAASPEERRMLAPQLARKIRDLKNAPADVERTLAPKMLAALAAQ